MYLVVVMELVSDLMNVNVRKDGLERNAICHTLTFTPVMVTLTITVVFVIITENVQSKTNVNVMKDTEVGSVNTDVTKDTDVMEDMMTMKKYAIIMEDVLMKIFVNVMMIGMVIFVATGKKEDIGVVNFITEILEYVTATEFAIDKIIVVVITTGKAHCAKQDVMIVHTNVLENVQTIMEFVADTELAPGGMNVIANILTSAHVVSVIQTLIIPVLIYLLVMKTLLYAADMGLVLGKMNVIAMNFGLEMIVVINIVMMYLQITQMSVRDTEYVKMKHVFAIRGTQDSIVAFIID